MSSLRLFLLLFLLHLSSCFQVLTTNNLEADMEEDPHLLKAVCTMEPINNSGIFGFVWFVENTTTSQVTVTVSLQGITHISNGQLGLHIHEFGDITDKTSGAASGGHYVGSGASVHGCDDTSQRHEGDLGNWNVVDGKISQTKIFVDLLTLTGPFSILGRTVTLHQNYDECTGQNLGSRITQGVIGIDPLSSPFLPSSEANSLFAIASLSPSSSCPMCSGVIWFFVLDSPHKHIRADIAIKGLTILSPEEPVLSISEDGDLELRMDKLGETYGNPEEYSWYHQILSTENSIDEIVGRTVWLSGVGCTPTETEVVIEERRVAGVIGIANAIVPVNQEVMGWSDDQCADSDQDSYNTLYDCDDSKNTTHPNALESCNRVDDDCNGIIDDDCPVPIYGVPLHEGILQRGVISKENQWDTYYLADTLSDVIIELQVDSGQGCVFVNQGTPPGPFPFSYSSSYCSTYDEALYLPSSHVKFVPGKGVLLYVGIQAKKDSTSYSLKFRKTQDSSSASSLSLLSSSSFFSLLFLLFHSLAICLIFS